MLASVSWRQVHNVLGDEGLKVFGKTWMELRCLRIEDDDASYISHSVRLLFHKVMQSYDIWLYMLMISPMLNLLWWGKVICT
jgi:hypothetical protein